MCNLHWCYTFCTGVTLFALVLHLNCTALSQSESSNFFMYIINLLTSHRTSAMVCIVKSNVVFFFPSFCNSTLIVRFVLMRVQELINVVVKNNQFAVLRTTCCGKLKCYVTATVWLKRELLIQITQLKWSLKLLVNLLIMLMAACNC